MTALFGFALVVLASVVAITSQASIRGHSGNVAGGAGLHVAGTALLTVAVVVGVAVTAIVVSALWPASLRRRKRTPEDEQEPYQPEIYWWEKVLALAIPVLLFTAVAAVIIVSRGNGASTPHPASASPLGATKTTPSHRVTAPTSTPAGSGGFGVTTPLIIAAVVVAAAAGFLLLRRRKPLPATSRPRRSSNAVLDALDWSLDDLQNEPDPRRAVVAAYARMERLLGERGVRRNAWEAPLEYLERIRGHLGLRDTSAADLTGLFQEAKFSPHAVGEDERQRAVTVLQSMRRELDPE